MEGTKGDVAVAGYEGWIAIESFEFGVDHAMSQGGKAGTASMNLGAPTLSEIVLTKTLDGASANLFRESLTGKPAKMTIAFLQTAARETARYLTWTLDNALITGYSISGDADDCPGEVIEISFARITLQHDRLDPKSGKPTPGTAVGWDRVMSKPV